MRRRRSPSEPDEMDRSASDRPSDATSVGHTSRATAGERKEHPSAPKGAPFHKVRASVFLFAIIVSGALFCMHYLRGEGVLTDNNGDTTSTSRPTGASLRAHKATPTTAPIVHAVPESSRKEIQNPKADIGEEPDEYLETLQAFDDKVDRLVRELEIALENAGPVRVQPKQNTDDDSMTKAKPKRRSSLFERLCQYS